MPYYQKTSIENESAGVEAIQFGNTDLIIKGPYFNEVTSKITAPSQSDQEDDKGHKIVASHFSFGNDLMPTY